jgi:pyruvate kinase
VTEPLAKTKIVATIGPSSSALKPLRKLIEAGVDVCRLNFSHGNHQQHLDVLHRIRQIEQELGRPVAVLQDLCGPKIRTTDLPNGAIDLIEGQRVKVVAGLAESKDPNVIGATLDSLTVHAQPGHRILFDDGLIELKVLEVDQENTTLECEVVYGGLLKKRKGINLPDTRLDVPSMTEKDQLDLIWGLEHKVDYVALSFVRHEDDARQLHEAAEPYPDRPRLIAKIEKPEAVERLEQIVKAFDGVMVARGDLSVETPLWNVPALQKEIIRQANLHDKLAITATQMLDSMQDRPRPTRAEVSDVANAIYDGTDAVMLSGETASGHYPVEAVKVMRRIAQAADGHADRQYGSRRHESLVDVDTFCDSICGGAIATAKELKPACLVTFTSTGKTALYMSKYHPTVPVVGATTDARTCRRMALYRGVVPVLVENATRSEDLVREADQEIQRLGLGAKGDIVIYVGGTNLGTEGNVNSLKVRRIGDEVSHY